MTRGARRTLTVDVRVESNRWRDVDRAEQTVRRAIAQAAAATAAPSPSGGEVGIILTDDSAIRSLNRQWRGIDAATNVLSFPTAPGAGPLLGDIVLAYETIAREARARRKPFAHHLAHLAVHGYLHLVGYDHDTDADAEAMEEAEGAILRRLAIPDPYRTAVKRPAKSPKKPAKRR